MNHVVAVLDWPDVRQRLSDSAVSDACRSCKGVVDDIHQSSHGGSYVSTYTEGSIGSTISSDAVLRITVWEVIKITIELLSIRMTTLLGDCVILHYINSKIECLVEDPSGFSYLRGDVSHSSRLYIQFSSMEDSVVTTIFQVEYQCTQNVSNVMNTINATSSSNSVIFCAYERMRILLTSRRSTNVNRDRGASYTSDRDRIFIIRISGARIGVLSGIAILSAGEHQRMRLDVDLVTSNQGVRSNGQFQHTRSRSVGSGSRSEVHTTSSTTVDIQ